MPFGQRNSVSLQLCSEADMDTKKVGVTLNEYFRFCFLLFYCLPLFLLLYNFLVLDSESPGFHHSKHLLKHASDTLSLKTWFPKKRHVHTRLQKQTFRIGKHSTAQRRDKSCPFPTLTWEQFPSFQRKSLTFWKILCLYWAWFSAFKEFCFVWLVKSYKQHSACTTSDQSTVVRVFSGLMQGSVTLCSLLCPHRSTSSLKVLASSWEGLSCMHTRVCLFTGASTHFYYFHSADFPELRA